MIHARIFQPSAEELRWQSSLEALEKNFEDLMRNARTIRAGQIPPL